MSTRPRPPVSNAAHDESEAPTLKWNRPAELSEQPSPTALEPKRVTVRVRKLDSSALEIEALDTAPESGLRAAPTPEEIERFEMRERRETLPAPPDSTPSGAPPISEL